MGTKREKVEEKSIARKAMSGVRSVGREVKGQQKVEEKQNEEQNNVETEATAEAIFESIKECRRQDEITVRFHVLVDKLVKFDQGRDTILIEGLDLSNKNVGVKFLYLYTLTYLSS